MRLFESGSLGKLIIKNRIVMAPMGVRGLTEPDGALSQRGIDYYAARAKGGVGLIVVGGVRANPQQERNTGRLRLDGTADATPWVNDLADTVHSHGAKIALQFCVGPGRCAKPSFGKAGGTTIEERDMVGPSELPCFWEPRVITRALTTREVEQIVEDFKRPAEIARLAGIDAIELHGHSGYIEDQFMTGLWNKRKDEYGGNLEGRLRFALELIRAVKKGAGNDFPVIYRFGLTHYLAGGREIDEGLEIARRLEAAGVDALSVDAGCYETHYIVHPSTYSAPGSLTDLAGMVKKIVKIPVITVGKLGFPELAERVLREEKADFIMLGKALLADPEWPNKVKEKRPEDIRPCIGDFECLKRVREGTSYISCTVNPATGKESEFAITQAKEKKTVLVVGGGPGGMEAARVAALRGHRVTLWEKGSALGGNLIPASIPDFKQDYRSLIDYLSTQLRKLGVIVTIKKEATLQLVQEMKPEVVFVATGSTQVVPEIPGVKANVVTATALLLGKREAGESVVVIGGGLVGCETALYLAHKGKKVVVVARTSVLRDAFWASQVHLMKLLADANVKVLTNTKVLEVGEKSVTLSDKDGKRSNVPADTLVLAVGFKPNRNLYELLKGCIPEVYAIGDCVEPRTVLSAIWEGFGAARQI